MLQKRGQTLQYCIYFTPIYKPPANNLNQPLNILHQKHGIP